jgi:hypothetical protein
VVKWAKLVKERLITELPRPLTEKVVDAIEAGHQPGLECLVKAAASLVADGFLTTEDMTRLTQALSEIDIDTQYTDTELESPLAVSISLIRAACTRLAGSLQSAVGEDATLRRWIEGAKVDPLPEVRFSLIPDQSFE